MGFSGACRRDELTRMSIDDIEYKRDTIHVSVPRTKTNVSRMFVITDANWIELIKKYSNLRPDGVSNRRFFLTYRNGRCTWCPIGINTIAQVPRVIAEFLELPNPEQYTGHCFRRSSASQLANSGGDLITIKKHGGWKSSAVAEGYIEASIGKKTEVAELLRRASPKPSTVTSGAFNSNQSVSPDLESSNLMEATTNQQNSAFVKTIRGSNTFQQNVYGKGLPGMSINAQDNSTITVKVYNSCTFTSNDN